LQPLFLSPHLDDAVFSCGGLINKYQKLGTHVIVITTCAGQPDSNKLSPFARHYHELWGNLADSVASRREEDQKVLEGLSAVIHQLDTPDSIYRWSELGPLYPDEKSLFSAPDADETRRLPKLWLEKIGQLGYQAADCVVYAPLAAGGHVDHQLVRLLGFLMRENGWTVKFYEDFPHAEGPGFDSVFSGQHWKSETIRIDVQAKINAMSGYLSQTPFIFGNTVALAERVKHFTAERAVEISWLEKLRRLAAGSGGRRERAWRKVIGYHDHAERYWSIL
jgi:LmbE family N-acetylglucosaminyl deacetylase